jgi:hypothetical protein
MLKNCENGTNLMLQALQNRLLYEKQVVAFIEAVTELDPQLPQGDKADLHRYQQSNEFNGDSRWPGWEKYLGPRPEQRRLRVVGMKRRSA